MADFTLVLGNKNYSSWSIRAWLAAKQTGAAFDEIIIPLDQPSTVSEIAQNSPSDKVPVLKRDGLVIWDSLAIAEYLVERYPAAGLWPDAEDARATARAAAAEMHAGFQALRTQLPMNVRAVKPTNARIPEAEADIHRIASLWSDFRRRFGGKIEGGPFLFGAWCLADAFYAPVVSRFTTYQVGVDAVCQAYMEAVLEAPMVAEWFAAARAEPWVIEKYDTALPASS
ncbi:MAG: glutathione S-transferase family protein [Candidatus Binatia bacterium]